MDLIKCCFVVCLIILVFVKDINGLTVSVPIEKKAFLKNSLELPCTYNPEGATQIFTISWERKDTNDDFQPLVTFFPPGGNDPTFATNDEANKLKSRLNYTQKPEVNALTSTIVLTDVECGDETTYRCSVSFFDVGTSSPQTDRSSSTVKVIAKPNQPGNMFVSGVSSDSVEEGGTVQFTCQTNVGRPSPPTESAFLWSKYRKGETGVNITGTTSTITQVANDCTFAAKSTVSLQLAPEDNGIVVRCTVQHETLSNGEDLHVQSQAIQVYYKVRPPQIKPDKNVYYEGQSMTLDCMTTGNPAPSFMWYLNGTLLQMGKQYKVDKLESTHAGTYHCEVQNTFFGITHNESTMFSLTIEPPITTPSTTPTTPTENPNTGVTQPQGDGDGSESGLGEGAIIAIAIVVPLVVIIIAVIIFCVLCRRQKDRKEIEEPSEKPRNNQDLSFVNNPDVVGSDGKMKNQHFNNQFDNKGRNGELQYADLTFDDRPRSRKPIQLYESDLNNSSTPYSEVMMPSV